MMIISTEENLEIGRLYNDGMVSGIDLEFHDAAFVVIAEATVEDYIKQCRDYKVCEFCITELVEALPSNTRFYKVQPD